MIKLIKNNPGKCYFLLFLLSGVYLTIENDELTTILKMVTLIPLIVFIIWIFKEPWDSDDKDDKGKTER